MLERASGQFIIDGQVEEIFGGAGGAPRIARISQTCRFTGQLEGDSMAEFTAVLPRESNGSFHGFQRVTGALGEREGSFVLSVSGEFRKGQPFGSWTIVPKSGSGDFVHIRGGGTFSLPDGKPGAYQLEYDLRKPRSQKVAAEIVTAEAPAATGPGIDAPAAVAIATPVAVTTTPARKTRAKRAEPEESAAIETPAKRGRPRKAAPAPVETPLPSAVETPAKRGRKTKASPVEPSPPAEAPPKRAARRKATPVTPEPPAVEDAPKPKRARTSRKIEPAAAEAMVEPTPAKRPRRTPSASPEPIPLPVTPPKGGRKRRANAA